MCTLAAGLLQHLASVLSDDSWVHTSAPHIQVPVMLNVHTHNLLVPLTVHIHNLPVLLTVHVHKLPVLLTVHTFNSADQCQVLNVQHSSVSVSHQLSYSCKLMYTADHIS